MASNIKINLEAVSAAASGAALNISALQSDAEGNYSGLLGLFAESEGEEADALKEQMAAEAALVTALTDTLKQFVNSVKFAANEFASMDSTGAAHM